MLWRWMPFNNNNYYPHESDIVHLQRQISLMADMIKSQRLRIDDLSDKVKKLEDA